MKRLSFLTLLVVSGLALLATGCAPGNPYIRDAESHLDNQNFQEALAAIDEALEEEPENAEAYLMRGRIYQEQSEVVEDPQESARLIEQMMEAYRQAIELNPELRGDVETRRFFAYQNAIQQGVDAFNRASEEQDPEAYSAAAAYFGSAGTIEPDSAVAFQNQAFALINAGQELEAIEPLERVVELGLDDPDSYILLGNLYSLDERPEEAIEVLEEARERYPDNEEVQNQLLNSYLQAGRTDEAMNYYEQAVQEEPDNATFRYNYGSLLLNADRLDEAIEQLERAVELEPDNPNALYNLGAAYVNKGVDIRERAVELDDELAQNASELSQEEITQLEAELEEVINEYQSYFRQAIEPLEQARQLAMASDDVDEQEICTALFQSYMQVGEQQQAQQVVECAGLDEDEVDDVSGDDVNP